MQQLVNYAWLIPLLPLLAAVVAGFAGARMLRGNSHWPIWLGVGGSAVLSIMILFGMIGAEPAEKHLAFHYETVLQDLPQDENAAEDAAHEAEGEHHGADGSVKAFSSRWFTWIGAGDEAQRNIPPGLTGEELEALRAAQPESARELPSVEGRSSGYFDIAAGAFIDPLTAVMLSVVCGIGFFITVFAAGYMKGEEGYWRFFAYLGLFIFAMTTLVMGDNLIMLYLGWEGVGLCSYLLIGYYYQKPAAREAAKKAFLVNRIGDFGFAIGIMLIFWCFGTVSYFGDGPGSAMPGFVEMAANYQAYVPADRQWAMDLIPFALMLGAFGKSAQFPLYVWLPDAMEGPTPVSALIHAATMVTAGVYMIARLSSVFYHVNAALVTIALIGAFTAAFAGTIGMRQFDLKKVFAYSTVSQLGYMFVGVAVLAPAAAVFHLVTHAFFKALLFLSSGVVMHAMLGHLDMRKMSGLKTVLPKTRILMLIGCLALAGFPLTSGFFSKDEIIHFAHHNAGGSLGGIVLYIVLLATAFLTAYYTFRLYFRVFEGPTLVPDVPAPDHHGGHDDAHDHGHASAEAVQEGDVAESGVDAPHGHSAPETHVHSHPTADGHGAHDGHHNHEPLIMILPLAVLAVGALLAGFLNLPGLHSLGSFLGESPSFVYGYDVGMQTYGGNMTDHELEAFGDGFGYGGGIAWLGLILGTLISIAGIALAWWLHLADRDQAVRLAHVLRPAARLLEAKYWVDEIYNALIVAPLRGLGRVLFGVDRGLIDGLVRLVAFIPDAIGTILKVLFQRHGHVQGYAVAMLFGVAVILLVIFL